MRSVLLVTIALTALSCGATQSHEVVAVADVDAGVALIPGTELADTPEARAVVEVIERYRVAFKVGDIDTLLALAAPDYHEDAGTPDPADDIDRDGLAAFLPHRRDVHLVDLAFRYRALSHRGNRVMVDVDYVIVIDIDGRRSSSVTSNRVTLVPSGDTYLFVSGM